MNRPTTPVLRGILTLILSLQVQALPGQGHGPQGPENWQGWLELCSQAQVLYLGEEHDGALDHQLQAETLEGLAQRKSLAVVAEMFQFPSRQVLTEYASGQIDDQELRQQSEWEKRWGHAWDLYLPIWQVCQQYNLDLRPLRNSSESGKNLGTQGLAALTPEERQGMAPEPYEFGPNPEGLRKTFEAHAGPVSTQAFERFLKVQVLWEEYMAAQVRKALKADPDRQVVVLVGKGHLLHGLGLPQRVQKGWPHPLRQSVVLLNPESEQLPRCQLWWEASPKMASP